MAAISVVFNQAIDLLNVPDGVVIDVMTPAASGSLAPGLVSAWAGEGTSTWGEFNAVMEASSTADILAQIGPQTVAATDLATAANLAAAMGVTDIRMMRIGDGTQSAAVLPVMATAAAISSLIGKFPGSFVNGSTITFTYSPLTPASMMQIAGNPQKIFVDATITLPSGYTEVYQSLDGNLASTANGVTTYAIDGPTLGVAFMTAVNSGIPNGQLASQYFIATAATNGAPGLPIIGVPNVVTTLGTDGATFAPGSPLTLDAAMLGSTAYSPATGMYGMGNALSGAAFCLFGCTDVATIAGPMLAYSKSQNGHAICSFPEGSPTQGSSGVIALKNGLGIADSSIDILDGNFTEIIDSVNGAIHRFVDPSAAFAARCAITAPNISPANQSMNGVVVGTTRVGSLGNNPYGEDEALALENAGVNFVSNDTAGDVGFAIAHNKNSLGKTAGYRGNIAYSRMIQFLVASYRSTLLGQYVGQDQTFDGNTDASRSGAEALFNGFLGNLKDSGIIDDFEVTCDLTNNSPGKAMLRVDTVVEQNEIIDVVAVGLVSGVGVIASVTPATSSAFSSN